MPKAKTKDPRQTHTFTNRELNDAKEVLDYLAAERRYRDTMTKVRVMRLTQEIRRHYEPVQEAIKDLIEEHGEGEPNHRTIQQGTPAMRRYAAAVGDLMKQGAVEVSFEPLVYDDLVVKRRAESGEREDEVIDLSPEDMSKLGPLLTFGDAEQP